MRSRLILLSVFITLCLGLGGCLDINEEYRINADGSGHFMFRFGLGEQALAMLAAGEENDDPAAQFREDFESKRETVEADPNVERMTVDDYREDGTLYLSVTIEMLDMAQAQETLDRLEVAMSESSEMGGEGDPTGATDVDVTIENIADGFRFRRVFPRDEPTASSEPDEFGNDIEEEIDDMMNAMFAGKTYTVRLYADGIGQTNGTVHDGYVEWQRPMTNLPENESPWELTATVTPTAAGAMGAILWIILGVGAALVVLVVIVIFALRSGRTATA